MFDNIYLQKVDWFFIRFIEPQGSQLRIRFFTNSEIHKLKMIRIIEKIIRDIKSSKYNT